MGSLKSSSKNLKETALAEHRSKSVFLTRAALSGLNQASEHLESAVNCVPEHIDTDSDNGYSSTSSTHENAEDMQTVLSNRKYKCSSIVPSARKRIDRKPQTNRPPFSSLDTHDNNDNDDEYDDEYDYDYDDDDEDDDDNECTDVEDDHSDHSLLCEGPTAADWLGSLDRHSTEDYTESEEYSDPPQTLLDMVGR